MAALATGTTAAAAAATAWLVKDGVARAVTSSGADMVRSLEKCVYTGLRTFRGRPVSLQVHMSRLEHSAAERGMAAPTVRAVQEAMRTALTAMGNADAVMMLATDGEQLLTHAKPIPPRPRPPVLAGITHVDRAYGEVKDSAWVFERDALAWPPGANELIIVDKNGQVLEGTSSNVFVVKDDALYTAGGHILSGSIRRLVLRLCSELNLPVRLEPPNWADRAGWQDVFITSTSRLVLPVDVLLGDAGETLKFESRHPIVARLDSAILAELEGEARWLDESAPEPAAPPTSQ